MEVSKFSGEKRISIAQAGRLIASLRGCERPLIATTYRWCKKGLRNIHLEHARVGGSIVTSEEAVRRFISKIDRRQQQSAEMPTHAAPSHGSVDAGQAQAASRQVEEFLGRSKRVPKATSASRQ